MSEASEMATGADWTPGPWRIEHDRIFAGERPYDTTLGYAYEAADAHLIAAAPDLYAALTKALPYFERSHQHVDDSRPEACPKCAELAEGMAALAKARGE